MKHSASSRQESKKEIKKPSVIPIYALGAVWVIYALIFPFYRWFDYLIAAAVSIIVYLIAKKLFPGHIFTITEESPLPLTEEEKLIADGELYYTAIKKLNLTLFDYNRQVSLEVARIQKSLRQILDYIQEHPEDIPKTEQCISYYLPTVLKFLRTYADIRQGNVPGENAEKITSNIEGVLHTTANAFEKLFDKLYADDALDISSDIKVLEHMIEQEGLKENRFSK